MDPQKEVRPPSTGRAKREAAGRGPARGVGSRGRALDGASPRPSTRRPGHSQDGRPRGERRPASPITCGAWAVDEWFD